MSIVAPLVLRICLVILFPFSTLDKIFNWKNALKQAQDGILPGGALLLVAAMFVETGCSILIVIGVALETMKQLEAQLMMRSYEGFLK